MDDSASVLNEAKKDARIILRFRQPRSEHVASFGPEAERWGERLFGGAPSVLADASASAEALEEATRRRRSGLVLTGPVLDEPRSVIARRLAPLIIARVSERSERRTMFDALARNALILDETTQSGLVAIDERVKQTLRDLYLVGVATMVRSRRQAGYLGSLFGRYRPEYVVRPGADTEVPPPEASAGGNAIVIWAPHTDIGALGIHLFALRDFNTPIVVIGHGDASAFPNIRVAPLASAERELRRAALIIDATLSDPASAVALAGWKIPLVAASSAGADEFLDGVRLYDPWNWRSILAAASAARADAPPIAPSGEREVARHPEPARPIRDRRHGPLVTIVVPTFDRADLLPLALDSLAAQSYSNIEILVVNDGGPSVDGVVSQYPRARCISNVENCGSFNSCNIGIENARGTYIGFLADDDIYYSDHVERLVAALEQSQAKVAQANALTRFVEMGSQGFLQTSGNQVLFASHLDVTEALWWGFLGCVLVRREIFDQVGTFDVTNAVADYEMLVRLSRSFDFVHVDHVTFEWRYRTDRSTLTHQVGTAALMDGLARVFERYPSGGDIRVDKGRAATLAFILEHNASPYWLPPIRLVADAKDAVPL